MGSSPAKSISPRNEKNQNGVASASFSSSSQWAQTKIERQITLSEMAELSRISKQPLESIDKALKYLEQRNIIIERGILGIGGGGFVLRAFSQYNDHLAVKFQRSSSHEQTVLNQREFQTLQKFNSQYITKVYDFFHESHEQIEYQVIVMERCMYDLKKYITKKIRPATKLNLQTFYSTCNQLAKGLKELHSKNIIHLDIKPANILIGMDLKWKYADLGISKRVSNNRQYTNNLIGFTAIYSSPEQYLLANNVASSVSKAVNKQTISYTAFNTFQSSRNKINSDIYSLGVVFLELTGVDVNQKWIMQEKTQQGNFDSCLNPNYEEFNNRVLKRMIQHKAEDRLDISELITILSDLKYGKKNPRKDKLSMKRDSKHQNKQEDLSDEEFKEINLYQDLQKDNQRNNIRENKGYNIKIRSINSRIVNSSSHLNSEASDSFIQIAKKNVRRSFQQSPTNSNEQNQRSNLKLPTLTPQPVKSNPNSYKQIHQSPSNKQFTSLQEFDNSPHSQGEVKKSSFSNFDSAQQLFIRNQQRDNSFLPQIKSSSNLFQNQLVVPKIVFSHNQYQQQQQYPQQQSPESQSPFQPSVFKKQNNNTPLNSARSNNLRYPNSGNCLFVSNSN